MQKKKIKKTHRKNRFDIYLNNKMIKLLIIFLTIQFRTVHAMMEKHATAWNRLKKKSPTNDTILSDTIHRRQGEISFNFLSTNKKCVLRKQHTIFSAFCECMCAVHNVD